MIYTNLNNSGEVEAVYAAKRATITGTPPLSYPSKGYDLEDFLISGNTVQAGAPIPEAPVDVVGCGEKTRNLVDPSTRILTSNISPLGRVESEANYDLGYFQIIQGNAYTIDSYVYAFYYAIPDIGSTSYDRQRVVGTVGTPSSFTAPITGYCCFRVSHGDNFMANSGSEALPYEPYGYKLPLTVNGTEYPIYLGQVETTRRIKKLVLTGEEKWVYRSGEPSSTFFVEFVGVPFIDNSAFCTHYINQDSGSFDDLQDKHVLFHASSNGTKSFIGLRDSSITSIQFEGVSELKEYLAVQYAAGTPVTVWCVLADPETGIVNEPLMKIGDYADTISLSQSGITVPTIAGTNTITTETTVLPSSISVTTPEKEVEEIYAGINYQDPIYYKIRTLTGTSPLTYRGLGQPLKDYRISGETLQDGTPSPDYPIDVVGCGKRTENLFDYRKLVPGYTYSPSSGQMILNPDTANRQNFAAVPLIEVEPGATYIRTYNLTPYGNYINFYDSNKNFLKQVASGSVTTVPSNCNFVSFVFEIKGYDVEKYMFTKDSTLSETYEPYGYKLPLTVNGTKYPIYLGQVPTTRRIKKLVLTGEESWALWSSGQPDVERYYYKWGKATPTDYGLICTHLPFRNGDGNFEHIRLGGSYRDDLAIFISRTVAPTVADFKSYLAAQYAAGTPVTVWYVLAESETGIVNEPLMKIGDYADTISFARAGVTIPTVSGANVLDMTSTVKPSTVSITGNIKPTGYGQLLDVNDVDIQDSSGTPIFIQG